MGLSIVAGAFFDLEDEPEAAEEVRGDLARLNDVLVRNGLPPHEEPEDVGWLESRAPLDSIPYSFLHHLRRVYAHVRANPAFRAGGFPEDSRPDDDPVLEAEYEERRSHLLLHSDCEGFYVPGNFEAVLFCDDEECPGGMVGSSRRLLAELIEVAPALGIRLEDGRLADAELERLCDEAEKEEGPFRELQAWMLLYEAARLSTEHGVVILFC